MAETVSVRIRIDDQGSFKEVGIAADDLGKAIEAIKGKVETLDKDIINWSQASLAAGQFQEALGGLKEMLGGLASGVIEEETNLAKLGQAMRNTMGATEDEIGSIDALCDAQERSGVTSKEAQLAGAQELATYLELSSSLETLIPVLNDMAAQQLGVGASGESVAQIASMLGKVMNGQTEALSRYGYKFDEAQKHILQFGDESERAAVLAEVVGESVGGMSQALRNTAEGARFAAETGFGNIEDMAGRALAKVIPLVDFLAKFGDDAAGILKLVSSFKSLASSLDLTKVKSLACAVNQKVQAAATKLLGASSSGAAVSVTALRVATVALYAAMTMGVALAIEGIVTLLTKLTSSSSSAADALGETDEATSAYKNAAAAARAEIARDIVEIEDLIKHKGQEGEKVEELNGKYRDSFGCYDTLADWYDVLQSKSESYCRQLGYQAKAQKLIEQQSGDIVELDEVRKRKKELEDTGGDTKTVNMGYASIVAQTPEYSRLVSREKELEASVSATAEAIREASGEAAKAADEMAAGTEGAAKAADWHTMSLTDLNKEIQNQKKLVSDLAGVNEAEAKSASEVLKQMEKRADSLGKKFGVASSSNGKSVKGLAEDVRSYREKVERAVEVQGTFNSVFDKTKTRLDTMKSGITELINKYGDEAAAVRTLVSEYYALGRERGSSLMDLPSLTGLPSGTATKYTAKDKYRKKDTYEGLQGNTPIEQTAEDIEEYQKAMEGAQKRQSAFQNGISAIGSTFSSLSEVVGEGAAAWLEWAGNLLQAIASAIPSIVALTTAKKAEATAAAAAATTEGAASVAATPWVGPAMAVAAVASIAAAFASIPKFAAGGIAYGPTLGLFGEYAGASSNPEVVAPLSRLRSLLGGDDGGSRPSVEFVIRGRDLVGVMNKRNRLIGRS